MMDDSEQFEDAEVIEAVRLSVLGVDAGYRDPLRRHLAAASLPRRRRVPLKPRWSAAGVLAAAAVILALLNPFSPRPATPVSARTLLERAAQVAGHVGPYRATAVITVQGDPGSYLPAGLQRATGPSQSVVTYAVRDATHFQIRVRTVRPALEAGTLIVAANGRRGITYSTVDQVATSAPVAIGFLGILGGLNAMAGTISQIVASLNRPDSGSHARLLGERTLAGQTTYLIKTWPTTREEGGSCTGANQCLKRSHGYGYALLWLDKDQLTTLRYEVHGPRAQVQHTTYRVTSIDYGHGPTTAELGYRPPVAVRMVKNGGFESGSGGTFGGLSGEWIPSAGFLPAYPPRDVQGHALLQATSGTEGEAGANSTAGVDVLFAAHVSSVPGRTADARGPVVTGAYLYLQEHIRLNGISPFFKTGIPHRAGGCAAWTGSYQNGLRWLGMQRGHIGIMLTSNSLSEGQLVTYARSQFCK
jgi:hypothetical protein